jgi:hypothetical protein
MNEQMDNRIGYLMAMVGSGLPGTRREGLDKMHLSLALKSELISILCLIELWLEGEWQQGRCLWCIGHGVVHINRSLLRFLISMS